MNVKVRWWVALRCNATSFERALVFGYETVSSHTFALSQRTKLNRLRLAENAFSVSLFYRIVERGL